MSKMDALRAMREAKYERHQAGAPSRSNMRTATTRLTPSVEPPVAPEGADIEAAGAAQAATPSTTCGHKSMNGRACTREAGHSEKSHRYS